MTHAVEYQELCHLIDALPIDTLQLHDEVEAATIEKVRADFPSVRLTKAVHVSGDRASEHASWEGLVDSFVLDSVNPTEDRIGGTGLVHNWSVTARIVATTNTPVFVAGGLTPENVAAAIAATGAYGANVNSGVERHGRKQQDLIRRFVDAANGGSR